MSGAGSKRKNLFIEKATKLFTTYDKMIVAEADFVGSSQLQKIRKSIRGIGAVLMGKKTMIRKVIRDLSESKPELDALVPYLKANTCIIFAKDNLTEVKRVINTQRVGAPAKAGVVAPSDVIIPAGPTGMEPTQTSFLQELKIATKINRGQIDIVTDVFIIKTGQRVGASEATLLQKLNIKPFTYGLEPKIIYDQGACYSPSITEEDLLNKFKAGISNIAAISLEIGYPTIASIPHSVMNAFKNLLAISFETAYSFDAAEKFKSAASAAPVATTAAPVAAASKPVAAKAPEPESDSDEDFGGGGLFGDD